jgi:predicted DNA-binding transcriptional regulator AlpA
MSTHLLNEDLQLVRRKDLLTLLTISEATLWRWETAKLIPGRVLLGPGRVAYRKSVVLAWLEGLEAN